jgi:Tfp pilus assembly protein PilF
LLALHPFLLSLQHDNSNLLTPVGEHLYLSGHVNEAEALWRRKTSLPLSTDDALSNLAVLEAGRGNHDQAFTYLKQALTINPEHEAARTNQAALLERIGTAAREV